MSGRLSIIAHLEVTRISPSDDLQRPLADRGNYWARSQVVRGLLKLKATKVTKRLLGAYRDMGMFPRGMMCEWGWGVCVMCAIWAEVFRSFIPGQRTRCDIRPSPPPPPPPPWTSTPPTRAPITHCHPLPKLTTPSPPPITLSFMHYPFPSARPRRPLMPHQPPRVYPRRPGSLIPRPGIRPAAPT